MTFTYNVFLSHNSKDKPAVEAIARSLLQKYSLKCWLDKWNLVPGEPWQEALEEALDRCETVAVFVGPNSISPWENEEMRSVLEDRVHTATRRVIPILLPGAPDKSDLRLPRFLNRLTWVDFRGGLHDEEALYMLYCGITGIKPEDYISRQEGGELPSGSNIPVVLHPPRERMWRLVIASCAVLLIGLIGYFVAINWNVSPFDNPSAPAVIDPNVSDTPFLAPTESPVLRQTDAPSQLPTEAPVLLPPQAILPAPVITVPHKGASVARQNDVYVTVSQSDFGPGIYLYVIVIAPSAGQPTYHVQVIPTVQADGSWRSSPVFIGAEGSADIGKTFQICAVLHNQKLYPREIASLPAGPKSCIDVIRE